jgi:hypothetical protein
MKFTCPRTTSPGLGDEIATACESWAANRRNTKGKKRDSFFISRTSKFNMKHDTGQIQQEYFTTGHTEFINISLCIPSPLR